MEVVKNVNSEGVITYTVGNWIHRNEEDGPAVEWPDGRKEYWRNNQLHRLRGPALVYPNGKKVYFVFGVMLCDFSVHNWKEDGF